MKWPTQIRTGADIKKAASIASRIRYLLFYRPGWLYYAIADKKGNIVASNINDKLYQDSLPADIYESLSMDVSRCWNFSSCHFLAPGPFYLENYSETYARSKFLKREQTSAFPKDEEILFWPMSSKIYNIEFFVIMDSFRSEMVRVNAMLKDSPPGVQRISKFISSLSDRDLKRPVHALLDLRQTKVDGVFSNFSLSVAGIGLSGRGTFGIAVFIILCLSAVSTVLMRQCKTVPITPEIRQDGGLFFFHPGIMSFLIFLAAAVAGPLSVCTLAIWVVVVSAQPGAASIAIAQQALPFLGAAGIIAVFGVFSMLYRRKIVAQMEGYAPDPE